jgi:pyruvate dehydrogenase kinase 2/3/4
MIFELLKNSLRAVVERYGSDYEDIYPPIKLVIAHGKEVSDKVGAVVVRDGVSYINMHRISQLKSQMKEVAFHDRLFLWYGPIW